MLNLKREDLRRHEERLAQRTQTQNGEVYSDFDVSVSPNSQKTVEDKRAQGGRFRIVLDKSIAGTISGGGAKLKFQTLNGDILLWHLGIWSRQDPLWPHLDRLIAGLKAKGLCFARLTDDRKWTR